MTEQYTELQRLALDAGKGIVGAAEQLKKLAPPLWCVTLEYCGRHCITDGAQLIELLDVENSSYNSLMELEPTIIDIEDQTDEELQSIVTLDDSYEARMQNLITMVATTGTPLLYLGEWLRWLLVQCDKDITDGSQDLLDASDEVVKGVCALDRDGSWLVQSACFHYAHHQGVPVESVVEGFTEMSYSDQTQFLNNVCEAMNLTIKFQ